MIIQSLILPKTDIPIVVILTPELNDTYSGDYWRSSFDHLAAKFHMLGAHAISLPWPEAPLTLNSSASIRYVANLVWGYHTIADRWVTWLHAWPKDIILINYPSLLLWNTRKTYLKELEKANIPAIPTLYVEQIDEKILNDAAAHFSSSDLIVKPQVSASGFNMLRVLVGSSDFAASPKSLSVTTAIDELIRLGAAQSAMMIQPFMSDVIREGEISVLMFAGRLSHAVRKCPSPDDYRVQHEYGGIATVIDQPSAEIIELAHASLAICPETPIYARIDMIHNHLNRRWCISELELIEPDLFLNEAPDGGLTFARTIMQFPALS
ncbi:unnamed protein product [Rotaria magnacalcarata]|uniref:Uncharacterized protein n=1 Tax=Rotaria magnacalcarata TaxID=392030 RepID=A0A820H6Z2_9BILA|nr:unnamed protein product [Rotaria magnacalcarata]CAF2102968.1 unnamed protein product [Rotaria magnacalcarata]CAF4265583.1 unnamed protein product [Rotaria magnacalcarata]CAF4289048.1 unnamed protein product [Rotaria magnacalcarata]